VDVVDNGGVVDSRKPVMTKSWYFAIQMS